MFPNKLITQALITVPKSLQIYTAATVNSSKFTDQTRAILQNVPCVKKYKNGTTKNKISDINGVGKENELIAKLSSFMNPLDVYKKVRKVNRFTQITKKLHLRTKTNILHTKSRNLHQDTRKSVAIINTNRIFKHRPQTSLNTFKFVSNRTGSLPPPSNGTSKNIDVPVDLNTIPNYKINVKLIGTIPPPTSHNENLIRAQTKDLPESSFNITMSKGKKVRPPSGTDKRCMMTSGRILKASALRKINDFTLLRSRESVLTHMNCRIHTTVPLTEEDKSISKSVEETKQKDIYYKQHFPNQPFSCPYDKIDNAVTSDFKKNRHFMKSYLRPVNLPPPTCKRLKVQTSNPSLPPVYGLEVKNDLSPSLSIKEKIKSPLLDLIENTKRAVENSQLPLNLNFSTTEGLRTVFDGEEDTKKPLYVKMQGNIFNSDSYNDLNGDKECQNYSMNDQIDNKKPLLYNTDNSTGGNNNYIVDKANMNFNFNTNNEDPSPYNASTSNNANENKSLEGQKCDEVPESPIKDYIESEAKNNQKYDPDSGPALNYPSSNTKSYDPDSGPPLNFQAPSTNNAQENKGSYNIFSAMNNAMSTTTSQEQNMDEAKYNFYAANINNTVPQERNDYTTESATANENKEMKSNAQTIDDNLDDSRPIFQDSNNDTEPSESDREHMKLNFSAADKKNSSFIGSDNFDMNNTMPMNSNNNSTGQSYTPNTSLSQNSVYFKPTNLISNSNNSQGPYAMSNLQTIQESQAATNYYYDFINRMVGDSYNNQSMHGMEMPNMMHQMDQGGKKNDVQKTGARLMKKIQSMKTPKGLAEIAKSFNHASLFIPKQIGWRKFKFPPPSVSSHHESNYNSSNSPQVEENIPKFKNFQEAQAYFVHPENLKKLTPAQIAMYNSIIYYDNVIKKNFNEIKRQKDNLEATQQAIKLRKTKIHKNK